MVKPFFNMKSLTQVVFPGFEPLDVFGPLEIFYSVKRPGHSTVT
jgi:hypothetical protein